MTLAEKCKAQVSDRNLRWPHCYQCSNRAVRDGYCNRHHPDVKKAAKEAVDRRYAAQVAYSDWLRDVRELRGKMADAVIAGSGGPVLAKLMEEHAALQARKPNEVQLPWVLR